MRKVLLENVEPGAKLARDIFSFEGRVLLTSGVEIRKDYIERLKHSGVTEVYIEDELSHGIEVCDVVRHKTREEAKGVVKKLMESCAFTNSINTSKVKELIDRIIDELLTNEDILLNLTDLKTVDDYTFEHSVNVCILALITGIGLGYNHLRLKDLGTGAILHDIGKLRIPESILKKPSQLTVEEFEEIKKHTVYGYEILKNNKNVSMISAFIAFGHHERYDGSGYPLQLRGENIHQCARIVAVADVYDALTSDRVYRKKLRPHEAVEYITSLGTRHFDAEIIESFTKYIALYPVGTGVLLSTREKALVVRNNRNVPTRPVVKIIYDENNDKVYDNNELDLTKNMGIFIVDSCEL
ncbi:MAG: HD-GYP domain-containing protein [Clostridia bacterium]|nr:HD-GYP domain-containing protein [Clostridia bacterium]